MKLVFFCSIILLLILVIIMFPQSKKTKVIFFGDSITEQGEAAGGYIDLIKKTLSGKGELKKYDLNGAGIAGDKVDDLLLRMQKDVIDYKPAMVVVYIGINDVWKKINGNGTPLDAFVNYYTSIIKKLQEKNIKVALCTVSMIGEKKDNANAQDADLDIYSASIKKLAAVYNCTLIDLRTAFLAYEEKNNTDNKTYGILTVDGVHLNENGNRLVADEMVKALFSF